METIPNLKALFGTGHRPNKIPNGYNRNNPNRINIRKSCYDFIIKAVELGGINTVISGMALGFDQDLAHAALDIKKAKGGDYIHIIAAVPFRGQELLWQRRDQELYQRMLLAVDAVMCVSEPGYAGWKMQKRNEWMVDMSQEGIALWDGTKGGTYNCLKYAKSKNIRVHNLLGFSL
jgi:uncharacterized phage-like protein YoqJ